MAQYILLPIQHLNKAIYHPNNIYSSECSLKSKERRYPDDKIRRRVIRLSQSRRNTEGCLKAEGGNLRCPSLSRPFATLQMLFWFTAFGAIVGFANSKVDIELVVTIRLKVSWRWLQIQTTIKFWQQKTKTNRGKRPGGVTNRRAAREGTICITCTNAQAYKVLDRLYCDAG